MGWVEELRQAFGRLQAGVPAHVSFGVRSDVVGELGREFNALASELAETSGNRFTREQAHQLRNRLAGILAVLHVQSEGGALAAEEQVALQELLSEAKSLDARLRRH
jgi:hypothetical protein